MNRLKAVMLLLIGNDGPLAAEWRDHPLKGDWQDYRECHVGGDFLLIYKIDDGIAPAGGIAFARAGTHSELFNE
jgi:mRNA interferase YafQ